jgi:hypothetical protein
VQVLPQVPVEYDPTIWPESSQLLLDQADVAAVSRQVHLALFYDVQLDIKAMFLMTDRERRMLLALGVLLTLALAVISS